MFRFSICRAWLSAADGLCGADRGRWLGLMTARNIRSGRSYARFQRSGWFLQISEWKKSYETSAGWVSLAHAVQQTFRTLLTLSGAYENLVNFGNFVISQGATQDALTPGNRIPKDRI